MPGCRLLLKGFQSLDVFSVRMGTPPELPFDSLIGIETQRDILKLRQGERNGPWLELLQCFDRQPQSGWLPPRRDHSLPA